MDKLLRKALNPDQYVTVQQVLILKVGKITQIWPVGSSEGKRKPRYRQN